MIAAMIDEFKRSLAKVLVHEGGKVDNKNDPGGRTNQGVIQRTYDAWRRRKGLKTRDVFLMTNDERDDIYYGQYWELIKGDRLAPGVSYVVFDGAVNSGVSQSVKWLQRALGVKADGVVGNETISALHSNQDHDRLIARILELRMAFLKALTTWKHFGKGWTARVNGVRSVGQAWAMGSVGPEVQFVPNGNQRANITDAKKPPATGPADASTGAGSISVVISQTTEQLTPLTNIEFVANAVAILTIAGAALAIGGIAYRVWAKRRAAELKEALA